ncbi:WxL protein peptidoglycan domain-containing protein [Streptacidiphilus pinicola]|uniref:WxL protein peptidoglycan domain-containing protein n=1 Tax=Streptacidiphilus pinicola TaxID=2219663 RepID=UPI001402FC5B|nr:DUF916 domain-containing protein [Streptacidiphilus pinicola]
MSTSPVTHPRGPQAAVGVAILSALMMTAAGTAAACPVRDSGVVGPATFGLAPAPTPAGSPRSYFDLSVPPGGSLQDSVIVTNTGDVAEQLKLDVSNGITAANSGTAYQSPPGACAGPGCWVTGLPATVSLAPHERRMISFRVTVPDGIASAQYLAGITAESADRPARVRVGSNGQASAQAIIVNRVTTGVAVTVGPLSRMRTALTVSPMAAVWMGSMPRLLIPVSNDGQRFAKATGTVSCGTGGRRHSYVLVLQTVLPGGQATVPVNAPGLHSGQLPCSVRLDVHNGDSVLWSGTVDLPSLTQARIIHSGPGTYAVLPAATTPLWAIALTSLGALILVALGSLIVLRQRQRPAPPPDGKG